MPTKRRTRPATVLGIRFPATMIDQLDVRAEALTKERGDRVNRSTVVREILTAFFAPQDTKGAQS